MSISATRPRALLITPSFFGYESDIASELESQGFQTLFMDERPSNRAVARAIVRARRALLRRQIDSYYRDKLSALEDLELDLVIVIKGEVVPRWFVSELRSRNPEARFVFYTWDALANTGAGNCVEILEFFDYLYSFDSSDIADRPEFRYLPLFYTSYYELTENSRGDPEYDLAFIGTLHSARYVLAKRLLDAVPRPYGFFYMQARWYFAVVKYLTREHRRVPWCDVSFASMSKESIADVFKRSHAVLDIQRPGQTGLTMRTFEVLATGAVLVTTNPAIRNEPFYDPSRIVVVPDNLDNLAPGQVRDALDSLVRPGSAPRGFERYSISAWVRELAGIA